MFEKSDSTVRLLSYAEDQPREMRGALIPRRRSARRVSAFTPVSVSVVPQWPLRAGLALVAACFMVVIGVAGYGITSQQQLASAPTVTIVDPVTKQHAPLGYGPQTVLGTHTVFTETRDAFIAEAQTFIEVDLSARQLRYFVDGVLAQTAEVLQVPEIGSWWQTPSGLYQVSDKKERDFSTLGQVYFPHRLTFGGNYAIHGQPEYPDGTSLEEGAAVGGIRLSDEAAKKLFAAVAPETPVLVHQVVATTPDTFVYEPTVSDIATPHYFVADIENGTILASTDLDVAAPIASLVKLMTAVVAAEEIDLEGRVRVTSPTFVTSLIPRLAERSSVSVYSLLQLLLVESSNEAAETLAGEVGRAAFLEAMNAKARQLGMLDTHFADPSGLSAENVSSLGDLYRLTKYIYDNRPFIFEITANEKLPSAYVGGEFGGLINFNAVEDDPTFVGGKVGETQAAGQTSISLHEVLVQGEERVIVIILLGSAGRTEDIKILQTYAKTHFGQ